MFVDFFIKRPIFATVCALMIVLAGAISIPTLPIALFPNLAPPQVTVSSGYTGASAQVVESAVTTPLEEEINGAEGMKYLSSTSGNDGSSSITATFDLNRNPDIAAVDIQNRVNAALGRLPNEVKATGVFVTKSSTNFVFGVAFYSENQQYDSLFISNYLDVYVRDALKRVPGVADVFIFGQRKYAMRLWLDPERMASRGLTASDVVNALREQNVEIAAGEVGQPPAPPTQAYQISVRAIGRLSDPAEFDNIVLERAPDGSLVRLRDVGSAELGAEDYSGNLKINGHDAVGIGVTQLSNANALEVDRAALNELARLSKSFPPGLKYHLAWDGTTVVGESIRDVLLTLVEAVLLVILVIFIFLQDWRATMIPAVTIPVSLIGTFIFVKLLNFSINTLTLFGLTLATGLVVDDAIVVIENVQRHISEGLNQAREATSVAMREVMGAVIATSLVLVSVFVPVALFPGTTGILFRQFALTIAFSVSISAFNALTLSPALAAILFGRGEPPRGRFFASVNRGIRGLNDTYRGLLRQLLRFKFATVVVFLLCLGLTYWVYQRVPRSFVPEEDEGYFMVIVQAPAGASLEYTTHVDDLVESELRKFPEVENIFAISGFGFGGSAPNRGIVFAGLTPYSDRKGSEHSEAGVIQRLRGPLMRISGAVVVPFAPPAVEGLGDIGGFQYELLDLGGHSLDELSAATQGMVQKAGSSPGIAGLFTTFSSSDPQFLVKVNREKAKSLGVPFSQISDTLGVFLGSAYVNDFDFNNRAYRVYVQASPQFRSEPRQIRQLYVRSDNGAMIPLDNLVEVAQTASPPVIAHYNLFRSVEVDGSAQPGYSSGQAIGAMEAVSAKALPRGFTYAWTGLSREEIESAGKAAMLFGLGLLFVYLTLAAQYESFSLPFIVMLAVPVALLGAVTAQHLRGLENDIYCQIGLVMLIGLASKNAILIVEFAEQLRERGLSITEAAIEAARIRLRPILMTSFAFILGVCPLMVASGAGQAGRHSVGTTVFGGMIAATSLNLLFIPVLYVVVQGFRGEKISPSSNSDTRPT